MCLQAPANALKSSSLLSFTKPFTPNSLSALRRTLAANSPIPEQPTAHTQIYDSKTRNAGVLIPFCNVEGQPGILFQVRAQNLRHHSGEVSFPGGRIDDVGIPLRLKPSACFVDMIIEKADASFLDGALRETQEELGIRPEDVDVLGEIGPPEISVRGDMRVWPYVGFVHEIDSRRPESGDCPYPSIDLNRIRQRMSLSEVAVVFHVPLIALITPARLRSYLFRGERPYSAVDVTDLVRSAEALSGTSGSMSVSTEEAAVHGEHQPDEVGSGREGRVEIWGLTGWYSSLLLRRLHMYQ